MFDQVQHVNLFVNRTCILQIGRCPVQFFLFEWACSINFSKRKNSILWLIHVTLYEPFYKLCLSIAGWSHKILLEDWVVYFISCPIGPNLFFWTTKTDSVTSGTFAKLKLVEQKSTNNVFGETLFRRLQILNTRFVSNKFWNGTAFDKTKTSVKGLNFVLRILTL